MVKQLKWQKALIFLSALFAIFYAHYRAYILAFTYDESWTVLGYSANSVSEIFKNTYPAANNHVLHSALVKIPYALFGLNEYALRFPVLIAQLVFLIFTYKLLKKYAPRFGWLVFIVLALNPYLLDYFTLARGYGISLAFAVLSVYYSLKLRGSLKIKFAICALLFSFLAAWSNFTYLLIFVSALVVVFLAFAEKRKMKQGLLLCFSFTLLAVSVLYIPLNAVLSDNELYYGGKVGFLEDTLGSLIQAFSYFKLTASFTWMVLVLIFAVLSLFFYKLWQQQIKKIRLTPFSIFLVFLLLPAGASIVQHWLLDTPYLIDRTALFFIPLFFFALARLVESTITWLSSAAKALVLLFFTFNCYSMYNGYNLSYFVDFKEHMDTKSALSVLSEQFEETPVQLHLGKSVYMNTTLGFYKQYFALDWLVHPELDFCDESRQHIYYYLFASDLAKCLNKTEVEVVRYFPTSDTYLLKRKNNE